jgi:hypothetical protein
VAMSGAARARAGRMPGNDRVRAGRMPGEYRVGNRGNGGIIPARQNATSTDRVAIIFAGFPKAGGGIAGRIVPQPARRSAFGHGIFLPT